MVASGLVVATSFIPSAAFAGTTDSVTIGGSVASTLAIAYTNAKADINLAPAQTNAEVKVADLTMGTNNSTGLTVTATGILTLAKTTGSNATPVPFTVGIVAGASGTPASYAITATTVFATTTAAAPSTAHSLYIKYSTDASFQDPGSYAATVVLTVADNN